MPIQGTLTGCGGATKKLTGMLTSTSSPGSSQLDEARSLKPTADRGVIVQWQESTIRQST